MTVVPGRPLARTIRDDLRALRRNVERIGITADAAEGFRLPRDPTVIMGSRLDL